VGGRSGGGGAARTGVGEGSATGPSAGVVRKGRKGGCGGRRADDTAARSTPAAGGGGSRRRRWCMRRIRREARGEDERREAGGRHDSEVAASREWRWRPLATAVRAENATRGTGRRQREARGEDGVFFSRRACVVGPEGLSAEA
jgi:hypothetical protein